MASSARCRLLVVGGNANNGTNCGFYGNWNVNSGNANWNYVARPNLSFVLFKRIRASSPLGENRSVRNGLVGKPKIRYGERFNLKEIA